MIDVVVILRPELGETFKRDSNEVCTSVIVKGGLLIVYMYSVSCDNYIFICITFLDREDNEW